MTAAPPTADRPEAVALTLDTDGVPIGVRLGPGWDREVPRTALGAMITALLLQHRTPESPAATARRPRRLATSSMPISSAHELQHRQAALQSELVALLPRVLAAAPTRVSSRHQKVHATLWQGRVVAVELDPEWIASAPAIAITEAVTEVFTRAPTTAADDPVTGRIAALSAEYADLSTTLDDHERS